MSTVGQPWTPECLLLRKALFVCEGILKASLLKVMNEEALLPGSGV